MDGEIRYCTTRDAVRIAYRVDGEGPPLLVGPTFLGTIGATNRQLIPENEGIWEAIGDGRSIIRYDLRGMGLSQRDVDRLDADTRMLDMEAVVREMRLKSLDLITTTTGGPTAIQFAAANPRVVRRLVLYGTYARPEDVMPEDSLRSLSHLARANWPAASQAFGDMSTRAFVPDAGLRWGQYYREIASAEIAGDYLDSCWTDVSDLLPKIRARTLVIHREGDTLMPLAAGQRIAAGIRGARLVTVPGTVHQWAYGDNEIIIEQIRKFLRETEQPAAGQPGVRQDAPAGIRTVLFTDVVGHTEMMRRLGDAAGRGVLREHEQIIRDTLKAHGGDEVKTLGDGFMASFISVTSAMECAVALQRSFAARNESAAEPLQIRVGLNSGEPIAEDGDLFGSAVILASRVAAAAEAGQILVPEPVRHLLDGKGFLFSDQGDTLIKGFEDRVRLFEVSWRE